MKHWLGQQIAENIDGCVDTDRSPLSSVSVLKLGQLAEWWKKFGFQKAEGNKS